MKILFNCTTNIVGGGIQTAANFIAQAVETCDFSWSIAFSPEVYGQLNHITVSKLKEYRVFEDSPAKSLKARKELKKFESKICPDIVYTMSGPAYVKFDSLHVLGCSNGFVSHAGLEAFFCDGFFSGFKSIAHVVYQSLSFRKADYWIFQTRSSCEGFVRRLRVQREKTFVVPNALGKSFNRDQMYRMPSYKKSNPVILIPAAPYPHKNLSIIPEVAYRLVNEFSLDDFEFRLTLNENSYAWQKIKDKAEKLKLNNKIKNIGPFKVSQASDLYRQARVIFLPTLLETFSATYIEAMFSGRPIVTSNRNFARDICQEDAFYVDPNDPSSCANKLVLCLQADPSVDNIVLNGFKRVKSFPDLKQRYSMIRDILKKIHEKSVH
ncbi:glycosyltransferase [Desulfonatronovibrio hydrogenovorans]|uniref:glycosyltransferase n=1 Tax=Desulfonatronovibrio hydrogenovorans TaxID=53245 RepID=UPI00048E07AC|nr:glycosyltransferase [Desulfonatronovibrio hydrogenovorans]